MKFIQILFFLLVFSPICQAQQDLSSTNKKAIRLFNEGLKSYQSKMNNEAYGLLKAAVTEDPTFFEAQIALADLCLDMEKYSESRNYFEGAAKIRADKFPPMYYRWAQADFASAEYSSAIVHCNKYLSFTKIQEQTKKKAERLLRNAQFAEQAVLNPVKFKPENLGPEINSKYSEYHPSITVDDQIIVFTRMRPSDELTDNGGSQVEEDFFTSIRKDGKWLPCISVGPPLNSHGNEGAHCLSPDGRFIFFTGCERPGGFGRCDIYVSETRGKKWSEPTNLGEGLNGPSWEAQPTVSADGREIIFVSKREGGKGMSDLWCSRKQANGSWGAAFNLGDSLNTDMEEFGPFLHPDGKTLYFSSAGHPGMGQRDFFISRKGQDGKWQKPINLGYPINTNGDETHMIISADGKKAYFSADREGGYGLRDIYSFDINPEIQPFAVTFMKGKVFNKKSDAKLAARFEIIDLFTKQIMAASSSDPISGEFLLSLPAGSSYALNVSAPGFLFFSENYTLEKELKPTDIFEVDIPLQPIEAGESIVLKNIFFATGSAELEAISQTELEKLLEFLNKNPSLKIEISGHTDDVGNEQLNLKLSQARAEAVKSYLVEKGIVAGRLTAKGYGKSKPIAPNTSDETRKLNRRTEFTVLSK